MNSLLFSKSQYFLVMLSNSPSVSVLETKRTNSRNMSRLIPVAESEAKLFSSKTRDYYQWIRYCYRSHNFFLWCCQTRWVCPVWRERGRTRETCHVLYQSLKARLSCFPVKLVIFANEFAIVFEVTILSCDALKLAGCVRSGDKEDELEKHVTSYTSRWKRGIVVFQ